MCFLPGVPVAHARTAKRLTAAPEAHAGRLGIGVEVAGQHDVALAAPDVLLDEPRGGRGLHLSLELDAQLVGGTVAHEQRRPEKLRREDLGGERRARVVLGPLRQVQVHLPHLPQRPAAHNGGAVVPVAQQPHALVDYVVARVEQIGDLVVAVAHYRFLEHDEVGGKLAKSFDEDGSALVPCTLPSPQVEREHAQHARTGNFAQSTPPRNSRPQGLLRLKHSG
jgi:hypothetical protein